MRRIRLAVLAVALPAASVAAQQRQLVPESFSLAESARLAIEAEFLTDEERSALRVFHGVWDERDMVDATLEAMVALNAWDFEHPSLEDERVPIAIRADALLAEGALASALELLGADTSFVAARIRAEALEILGRLEEANAAVDDPVRRLQRRQAETAAELTEGVRTLIVRSRLQGQPARDFQTMLDLFSRAHQQLDRLYWPAKLAEARLLMDKDQSSEAITALHETLALNPRCSEAWYLLGRAAVARFDFASAGIAARALHRQNPVHPLAGLLLAESMLVQDDPEGALDLLEPIVARLPWLRPAHALIACAHALRYDEDALRRALDAFEALSPGSAIAYHEVGRVLSFNRQYDAAAVMLEEAIRRQPKWPAPQIELGLMELQSGRETKARNVLQEVVELDPFNKRAANSLTLLEELATYPEVETEHFIIRYAGGIDRVMIDLMPETMEQIHETVSGRFAFEPDRKTIIEVLPDHKRFSVRITGMPWIHTVAACTGPVIALEVPREGRQSEHLGLFDWPRVLQHEYAHTITLAQTQNRIPHWLTEAAAVSMEEAPRDYQTHLMLVQAYETGTLFDLDEIKWAFVRPKRPQDRSQAYAQGHWMVEFMNERFGSSALIRLLEKYFDGLRETEAMPEALGISRDRFYADFLEWAGKQVEAWGFAAEPSLQELTDRVRMADPDLAAVFVASQKARLDAITRALTEQVGEPATGRKQRLMGDQWPELVRPPVDVTDELLAAWLADHPDHPDLVELDVRRRLDAAADDTDPALVPMLERYAGLRPVDPMPHKKLAKIWLASDTPERAIPHLEQLDAREQKSPVFAVELARLYRTGGDAARALEKVTRAVHVNPYHAANREMAAAIAIEARQLETARTHIFALTLIEPNRPRHAKRLERIDELIGAE